ncbi:MAG: SPOR domain-containing protein [Bacteroidota bacterium]
MNQRFLKIILFFVAAALALAGCVPSEETGAGNRAKSPVQIFGTIDTTHRVVHRAMSQDTISQSKIDSVKIALVKKPRVAPKFRSRQDTVRASVVTKSKSSSHPLIKIIRPEHPVFTVQVGAFSYVSNALRAQKKAKEHFASQPVFNTFVKRAKLYRVSIGRYENRKDAFALYDSLKQKYPDEYKLCWINFIP